MRDDVSHGRAVGVRERDDHRLVAQRERATGLREGRQRAAGIVIAARDDHGRAGLGHARDLRERVMQRRRPDFAALEEIARDHERMGAALDRERADARERLSLGGADAGSHTGVEARARGVEVAIRGVDDPQHGCRRLALRSAVTALANTRALRHRSRLAALMQCPHCGDENPAGFRVCGFCATPLASTAARPDERKLVTLVFADVSGSTALGEQFDAEVVRRVMLEFFEIAREVLERHGGIVEKFVGDAVMAAFGIPRVHEDDALRAVRAAADLRQRLRAFGREVEQRYGTPLGVRIGVNTGEVVAGEATSAQAFASGDAVNLTARLEQAAPPGEVLLGETTVRLLRGAVAVAAVEPLALKGKSQPVPAWRLIDVRPGQIGATRR